MRMLLDLYHHSSDRNSLLYMLAMLTTLIYSTSTSLWCTLRKRYIQLKIQLAFYIPRHIERINTEQKTQISEVKIKSVGSHMFNKMVTADWLTREINLIICY